MGNDTMHPLVPNDTSDDESTCDTARSDRSLKICLPVVVKSIYFANGSDNEDNDSAYSFGPPSS